MISFKRRMVQEGGVIPKWYGIAHYDWQTSEAVCYRIPLNVLVTWYRIVRMFFKTPPGRMFEYLYHKRIGK